MSLADLYADLNPDPWRSENDFSQEIRKAHEVMLYPFSHDPERREALGNWLQGKHQPCLFGRIAAKHNGISFCFLTTEDLLKSDEHVREKIDHARKLWKRRALRGEPRHGFFLSVCDQKVALANPDEALRRFALHIQTLAGWAGRDDINNNEIIDEWIYLQHPESKAISKFTFSVDFFASAADGRWWQDHRVPGGLAFTANSLGHMVRHQEWFGNATGQIEWALRSAMLTIEQAAKDAPHCPATYLIDESHGRPIRPYNWTEATPPPALEKLRGKDCGSYAGYLHTDHAVRSEFFEPHVAPSTKDEPYLMDFAYIFDPSNPDYGPFMAGVEVDEDEVRAELGRPEEMRTIADDGTSEPPTFRAAHITRKIEEALAVTRTWRLSDEEEATLR